MPQSDINDLLDHLISDWKREKPDIDPDAMRIVGRIINISGRLRTRADQALKEFNLHYTDLDVLATLRRSGVPYRMTPTELSSLVLLTSGAMTASLNRLKKQGMLLRASDKDDKRVKAVILSKKGKNLIEKAIAVRFEEASESISGLTRSEQETLSKLLKKLSLSLKEISTT